MVVSSFRDFVNFLIKQERLTKKGLWFVIIKYLLNPEDKAPTTLERVLAVIGCKLLGMDATVR